MVVPFKKLGAKVAPSVEHLAALLSWKYMQWRPFLRDVLYEAFTDGRVYSRKYLAVAREKYGTSTRTMQRWFKKLVDLGILEKRKEGKIGEGGPWYYEPSDTIVSTLKTLTGAFR